MMDNPLPGMSGANVAGRKAFLAEAYFEDKGSSPHHWRWPVLVLLVCSALVLLSFHQTLFSMVQTWSQSRSYSHCFLIIPMFVYLIWVRRQRLADLRPAPNGWGLPLIAGLSLVWIAGNLGEVKIIQEFAVVAILITVVGTLLGFTVIRVLAFPFLFLFFAVPFGASLIRPLQNLTTWFVINALTISHVPAVLENHTLWLPSGVWTVAEACSGIRFLLSAVVLGAFFASLAYRSPKRQLIFMGASIVVPVVANGFRAYGTVLLGYLSSNRLAAGVDHIVYGAVFAILIQLALIVVGLRWRENRELSSPLAPNYAAGFVSLPNTDTGNAKAWFVIVPMAMSLIALPPLAAGHLWNKSPEPIPLAGSPVVVNPPWQIAEEHDQTWIPNLNGTDRAFTQSYTSGEKRVDLDWGLYSGRRAMNLAGTTSPVDTDQLWADAADSVENAIIGGRHAKVHQRLIGSGIASHSVWTWYSISGEYTADPTRVRFLQAKARLMGAPANVTVIRVATDGGLNPSSAQEVLQDFLRHASFLVTADARPTS